MTGKSASAFPQRLVWALSVGDAVGCVETRANGGVPQLISLAVMHSKNLFSVLALAIALWAVSGPALAQHIPPPVEILKQAGVLAESEESPNSRAIYLGFISGTLGSIGDLESASRFGRAALLSCRAIPGGSNKGGVCAEVHADLRDGNLEVLAASALEEAEKAYSAIESPESRLGEIAFTLALKLHFGQYPELAVRLLALAESTSAAISVSAPTRFILNPKIAALAARHGEVSGALRFLDAERRYASMIDGEWSRSGALGHVAVARAMAGDVDGALSMALALENVTSTASTLARIAAEISKEDNAAALSALQGARRRLAAIPDDWRVSVLEEILRAEVALSDASSARSTGQAILTQSMRAEIPSLVPGQLAKVGEFELAKAAAMRVASMWRAPALSDIARLQSRAGDVAGARDTIRSAMSFAGAKEYDRMLVATAMAEVGDIDGAREFVATAEEKDHKISVLVAIGEALVDGNDADNARNIIPIVDSLRDGEGENIKLRIVAHELRRRRLRDAYEVAASMSGRKGVTALGWVARSSAGLPIKGIDAP